MKDILGAHYEDVKSYILDYLSTNTKLFIDRRVLKSIKLHIIDDSDEQCRYRQKKALRQQILESEERYDLKWMSILLIDLIGEDFENVAYTLKKINYDRLPNEIVDKFDLLRRVSRFVYLYHGDNIIDALENLMQHPASNSISTAEILWLQYHYYDSEERDYELLVNMANQIIKYHSNEYSSFFFLGWIFVEQEFFKQALDSYSKALEICKNNQSLYEQINWLYMRVADCLFNLKRHKEVIENTDHALQYYGKYNVGNVSELEFFHFIFKTRCKSFYILKDYKLALDNANSALEYCEPENREAMLSLKETIEKHC
jgi:tetratricopeptide (TPR) repeat protein